MSLSKFLKNLDNDVFTVGSPRDCNDIENLGREKEINNYDSNTT
jgi:hypothetical protein